ncbi:hypothetical protein [Tsukamurella sp. 1534]|uniref:hypothetical protein n=1 Tax=Tsukamurella sp. 1534 TaxID=1151061 RepID=UPI0002F0AACC|nr:hypothetical protein [Tsukamurella sp. 1534]
MTEPAVTVEPDATAGVEAEPATPAADAPAADAPATAAGTADERSGQEAEAAAQPKTSS